MGGNWDELTQIIKDYPGEQQKTLINIYGKYQELFDDVLAKAAKTNSLVKLMSKVATEDIPNLNVLTEKW